MRSYETIQLFIMTWLIQNVVHFSVKSGLKMQINGSLRQCYIAMGGANMSISGSTFHGTYL